MLLLKDNNNIVDKKDPTFNRVKRPLFAGKGLKFVESNFNKNTDKAVAIFGVIVYFIFLVVM